MKFTVPTLAAGLSFFATSQAQATNSTICRQIAQIVAESPKASIPGHAALACLQSVPIDTTAASQFVKFFNASLLQFQSTSAYLRSPPSGYQQPGTDLQARLQGIQDNLHAGRYSNEYDFELDVWRLVQTAHDGHLAVHTGALGVFIFKGPFEITSVSQDGHQLPQVYAFNDLNATISGDAQGWAASPLLTINGEDAGAYLRSFASDNALGMIEAHTDWNVLMKSPAGTLGGLGDGFFGSPLFAESWWNITFANGSAINQPSTAIVSSTMASAFSNISSGQDFYKTFVKVSTVDSTASATNPPSSPTATQQPLKKWALPAYPQPFLVQKGFGVATHDGGSSASDAFVSGYLIADISLAVLSIPTFEETIVDALTFQSVVTDFIAQTKQAGVKHVLIDVQANPGGDVLLAADTFAQFFPDTFPASLARLRLHESANLLGQVYSKYATQNASLRDDLPSSNWIAQNWLNAATGQSFSSWDELADGPRQKGDNYSTAIRSDLSNLKYTSASTGTDLVNQTFSVHGVSNKTADQAPPFDAQNIAILTDGTCSSTCTILAELMHHVKGVRIIVAGGLPEATAMQGIAGVRGSQTYTLQQLQNDVINAQAQNVTSDAFDAILNTGIQVTSSSFNLFDTIRGKCMYTVSNPFSSLTYVTANESFPLQFEYAPADCRIFYTPENFNNYTALWSDAANALWGDGSLCIGKNAGPPGFASSGSTSGSGSSSGGSSTSTLYGSSGSASNGTASLSGTSPTPTNVVHTGGASMNGLAWSSLVMAMTVMLTV